MLFVMLMKNLVKVNEENPSVAVRSSATAEDLPDASFAGQQDTYLMYVVLMLLFKK